MKATAVIAAYNEENTIQGVIDALRQSPRIDEVIVVSDGSDDRTVQISRAAGVRTLALSSNYGKGYAMRLGVQHAKNDILFFVDGDMLNLNEEHIGSLIDPVLENRCHMNVGIRHRGPISDFLHVRAGIGPILSGIRVMHRDLFETVPVQFMSRFKIETALNYFCSLGGYVQRNTIIRGLGHVIKENKRGFSTGLAARCAMTYEVTLLLLDLYLLGSWKLTEFVDQPVPDYEIH